MCYTFQVKANQQWRLWCKSWVKRRAYRLELLAYQIGMVREQILLKLHLHNSPPRWIWRSIRILWSTSVTTSMQGFPSYTTQNAPESEPTEFHSVEAKAMAFKSITFLPESKINARCSDIQSAVTTPHSCSKLDCHQWSLHYLWDSRGRLTREHAWQLCFHNTNLSLARFIYFLIYLLYKIQIEDKKPLNINILEAKTCLS